MRAFPVIGPLPIALLSLVVGLGSAVPASPQEVQAPPQAAAQKPEQAGEVEPPQVDVFDLLRQLRHKDQPGTPPAVWDWHEKMVAAAPVIGAKPSSGLILGAAGNIAFFRGDPATTTISSTVVSLTFSAKKQTAATGRFTMFTRDDRWRIEGDNRAQWTSQDAYGLGTSTAPADKVNAKYDFFRVYETVYRQLRPSLFGGIGLHYSAHTNLRPGTGTADDVWAASPVVVYSQQHGFALDSQVSGGTSLNLLVDSRDSPINASGGWLANTSYRTFFKGFMGGDSVWQELYVDVRTYKPLESGGRKKLAFWVLADLVTGGTAPYLDLPATGMDTYGRSGRGYGEGRFRGERLLYGEVEYRASLMRNGLLGMVVFANVTTVTNLETGERLFDTFAPGAGAGLRLLINKRSKTNLCFDVGFGKEGSRGVYLAIQEAF